MLLRYIAIFLLVWLALRLLGRLLAPLLGSRQGSGARAPGSRTDDPRAGGSRSAPGPRRQLAPCSHCGTYFDPQRALTDSSMRSELFCSETCLEAHSLEEGSG